MPDIKGLAPKENIKAWVDRKLFIHNLGHSAAAYIGYVYKSDLVYIHEVLALPVVYNKVRETMLQSADIILKKYPGEFTPQDLDDHISDLLNRFQNVVLGDTIFRVGCDLRRKLGPEDRLSGAIKASLEFNLPYDNILCALICGCHFRAKDEDGKMLKEDAEFVYRYENNIKLILSEVCGFDESEHRELFLEAEKIDTYLRCLEY